MAPAAAAAGGKRIEVDGVENVAAFRDAVELMFEADPLRWLARAGVSRAIGVLEVRCISFPLIPLPFLLAAQFSPSEHGRVVA
jgi:hypothetical protein